MILIKKLLRISNINKFRLKSVLSIAFFWTAIDFVIVLLREHEQIHTRSIWFREGVMFSVSLIMGYVFVFKLRKILRNYPLWLNFLAKSIILLGSALIITMIIQVSNAYFFQGLNLLNAYHEIQAYALHKNWLLEKIIYWLIIFFITQLILIINEKYSPGVFIDILTGKYIHPKNENRIVMFIDLKDSTPIAEKLGHSLYFEFIREFIYEISLAIIEFEGIIYQYVGDEVVCSWKNSKKNTRKCLDAVIRCRRNIQRKGNHFRRKYSIIPEFRVGIHAGEVTIGEIGVVKKDLAMSGDTMNTTARIRSACDELKHHFIVSKAFVEAGKLKGTQIKNLGMVDLKGKENEIELYSLKI